MASTKIEELTLRIEILLRGQAGLTAREMRERLDVPPATLMRALREMPDLLRLGAGPRMQYALRDEARRHIEAPIFRVSPEGRVSQLGQLVPVRPDGFVLIREGEPTRPSFHEGLPWWMNDMRPQGFIGRMFGRMYAQNLGLGTDIKEWTDTQVLQALLVHGGDSTGNLLVGQNAAQAFLSMPPSLPLQEADKPTRYVEMAADALNGEAYGSSAGGEQPKFTAYVEFAGEPAHVLVKFSEAADNDITRRWRDLLCAEHLALETLRANGVAAAQSHVYDFDGQRFLEVKRFDRVGERGRRAMFSLEGLTAEFSGKTDWIQAAKALKEQKVIKPKASDGTELLWAFGHLIGNTDMHLGNVSFISDTSRPYDLAPAYDVSPMCFAPRTGGGMSQNAPVFNFRAGVRWPVWKQALAMARQYMERLQADERLSEPFQPCINALGQHVHQAGQLIDNIG